MSSENSSTTNQRLRHFGFYRSIDARTEEFLKLSKKRQLKQGCACAAVSTAITVTIVVVILLIYEYAISVESSAVQRILHKELNDHPIAEKLDRSHFGFDQDYYEKMPLLVNALQENNYIDPSLEIPINSISKDRKIEAKDLFPTTIPSIDYYNLIRRTSPKPLSNYEYKHPTPAPFSKTYGSRNWLDNYRNTQRLRNLQQLVKYLEKTINAKIGNSYENPQSHIAFSGFVPQKQQHESSKNLIDLSPQSSLNIYSTLTPNNHLFDPLHNFKPQSPGEVNQLADSFSTFTPSTPSVFKPAVKTTKIAMFRPITYRKRHCIGVICDKNHNQRVFPFGNSFNEERSTESPLTTKSFSMTFNLYPLRTTVPEYGISDLTESAQTTLDQVYLTTARPKIQFKRKLNIPIRQTYLGFKRPRSFEELKVNFNKGADFYIKPDNDSKSQETKLFYHDSTLVSCNETQENLSMPEKNDNCTVTPDKKKYTTDIVEISADNVEDIHAGSSGIISIETRSNEGLSSYFETTVSNTDPYQSNTKQEAFKFDAEDAKIPEQYLKIKDDYDEIEYKPSSKNSYVNIRTINSDAPIQIRKNETNNTKENSAEHNTEKTSTTSQINGHYKSVNQNSQNINDWISNKTEIIRKIRLQSSIGDFRIPSVPTYIEIKRNNTFKVNDE